MSFKNPEYLYLLLLLIPMLVWYFWELKKSNASVQISSIDKIDRNLKTMKMRFRNLPFLLRYLALVFLIIAIARPQSSIQWRKESKEGIDIMIAMDISGSMMADDLKPSRLDAAKSVAIEFIQSRPNDNIGLVIFAAETFTQCPLTTDHAVLINLFNQVDYGMVTDGTAIGLGLANAVSRLKESKAKSKVVILLTDGSNNAGDIAPRTAAEIASTFGIRVYTIGIGAEGLVNMPVQTPFGTRYQQMKSDFDEVVLNDIASMTGGKYFRATDNTKLRAIYQEIDQLEKTKISVQEYSNKSELYFLFALIALTLLLLEVILRNSWLRTMP